MDIDINLDLSVEENAQVYFERAKKSKKKLQGAIRALEQTRLKLSREEKSHKSLVEKEKSLDSYKARSREWYEKFKWFISSDGFLVIGGRDSSSNELIIKKHADSWNFVFHSEAPGSPFVVIKNDKGQDVPRSTKEEAAVFALLHSKAWELNIRSAEVFEVRPEQVSKEAKSGEFVSKGSFIIQGKKTIWSVVIDFGIGYFLKDDVKVIMGGPLSAVSKNCVEFFVLKQGSLKKGEISKKLMSLFKVPVNDDFLSALPSGKFDFAKKQ